jgi:hypothetical protein
MAISLLFLLSCATSEFRRLPLDARYQQDTDRQPILIPEEREISEVWDRLYHHGVRQLYRVIDIPAKIDGLGDLLTGGDGKEADDINAWGEVADSSWYTNRVGKTDWSIDDLQAEMRRHVPPDQSGPGG